DTQLVILSAASQREDRGVELPPNLKGGAAHKVVSKLLGEGLLEEVAAGNSLPVWRRHDHEGPIAVCITPAGLTAIGSTTHPSNQAGRPGTPASRTAQGPRARPDRFGPAASRTNRLVPSSPSAPSVPVPSRHRSWRCSGEGAARPSRQSWRR